MAAPPVGPGSDVVEHADIQALVFHGHKHQLHAAFVPIVFDDRVAAGRWLQAIAPTIARGGDREAKAGLERRQIALSGDGLRRLGLPPDTLEAMPQELMDGMASRARVLGDPVDDLGRPTGWTVPAAGEPVHALYLLYAATPPARDALLARELAALPVGVRALPAEISDALRDQEHFGFADGLSQPYVIGQPRPREPGQDAIRTGELVLGYRNQYGLYPETARLPDRGLPDDDLGRNGSFLVFRKLEQRVGAFWQYFAGQAAALGGEVTDEWLAAKAMGRWRSGTSLVHAPDRDDQAAVPVERKNDFRYLADDADGRRCPIASHVRRANPRDARGGSAAESLEVINRHRIVRRGRSYGPKVSKEEALALAPDADGGRGLYFIALGASIARGFEFIQQTWLTSVGFHGLHREPDLISGGGAGDAKEPRGLTIPLDPVRLRLAEVPRFVEPRGGGYFFLPGLRALRALASWATAPP